VSRPHTQRQGLSFSNDAKTIEKSINHLCRESLQLSAQHRTPLDHNFEVDINNDDNIKHPKELLFTYLRDPALNAGTRPWKVEVATKPPASEGWQIVWQTD
jgi:hypothetical protein